MRALIIRCLLSLSLCVCTRGFKADTKREFFMKVIGQGWSQNVSFTVIHTLNTRYLLEDCSAECLADEDCGAVDHNTDDGTCVLHRDDKCVDEADVIPYVNGPRKLIKKDNPLTLFRARRGSGDVLYDVWHNTISHSSPDTFKSRIIDECWSKIKQVQVRMVNAGQTVAFFDFDTNGTNKTNWFTKDKLLGSSYNDLDSADPAAFGYFFSIDGETDTAMRRRFYVNKDYRGSCSGESTWLMVLDGDPLAGFCDWQKPPRVPAVPWFLYCPGTTTCYAKDALFAEEFSIIATF